MLLAVSFSQLESSLQDIVAGRSSDGYFVRNEKLTVKDILQEFYHVLNEAKSPVIPFLNKGIELQTIKKLIDPVFVNLEDEAMGLFQWRNGCDINEMQDQQLETWIFPLASFIPLEGCVERYHECLDFRLHWPKKLFPIFDSRVGDLFAIDTDVNSLTRGMIYMDSPSAIDFLGPVTVYYQVVLDVKLNVTKLAFL